MIRHSVTRAMHREEERLRERIDKIDAEKELLERAAKILEDAVYQLDMINATDKEERNARSRR